MEASVLTKYGSPDFIELKDIDKPTPGDNEILIKVHAASINSWDRELMIARPFVNRFMAGLLKPTKIKILGADMAGQIKAVGKNITQFQPGDEVYGDISACGWGGFAEYVCAPEKALALKPASLTFEQAAAVPQAALLALQGLRKGHIQQERIQPKETNSGNINPVQKVLINGASGGVGSFAVQIAKSFGAELTGVCSTKKMEFVRSLGADHVIDYTQDDFTKNGLHYDLILDVKGYHSIFDYKRALSPRGIYVMVGGSSALVNQVMFLGPLISLFGSKKMGLLLYKANKGLADLNALFESGKLQPVIDKCYPLSEVAEALQYFAEGHAKGKVIITL